MAIDIKFDLVGNPEPPTIVLANRNGNKLGQLDVNTESIDLSDKLNDVSEFTFTLNKYVDDKLTNLWDKVVDFKLVYCKEWDMWFEIKVELDEATETIKTVFCTQLGQAELSQIMLYNIEINTEEDIERDDYKISILYDENDPKASILHRLLDKAPHYSIAYVDPTIARIQRSFSFDGTSICDAFGEIGEEIGCLFVYDSNSDVNGMPKRTISVYDLQQYCNDCKYRGEFTDICPKCNSTNIKSGYGDDTLIFVTSDELASEGIQLVTDTDSVKNCFKLEAGDDLMTATVRNCNPNGTDYIWYFSDSTKEDMSNELVEKIESYDEIYKEYYSNYKSEINTKLLDDYNVLVDKYSIYNEDLQPIPKTIVGYSALMNAYYNTIDLALYLKSGLMPSIEMSETNAEEQAKLLTPSSLSPVAVENIKTASRATANSAVLSMAKIIVKSTYKVEIENVDTTSWVDNGNGTKTWRGKFIITNYSDEEDTATSETITVQVNGDKETFIKQKIEKALNKENTDDYSISGLFKKEYDDFCKELKKYALNPLTSFYDASEACISILIAQKVGENTKSDLYKNLYTPYYNKLKAIESEIKIREDEINLIIGVYNDEGNLVTEGLQQSIEDCKSQIQNALDFESYLGEELWLDFCAYRREDKYSNENYISDGLNNAELFKRALEFIEVAENEIYKSSELQHSISATLNNLLAIPKFKKLVKSFKVGNWIRVQVDDEIYKLRLLEYDIDYGDFSNIPVEFSDVAKIKNGITDVADILSQTSSMASSYDTVKRQSQEGNEAQGTIEQWLEDGLNSANVRIQNNDNEEILITKNGLLARSHSDITDAYEPEQFKLTHNVMAYTTDNWETVSTALGKHGYVYWDGTKFVEDEDYGLSTKFVTAGYVTGSQMIGGEIVSSNYESGKSGTYFNLINGDFEIAGGNIVYETSSQPNEPSTLTLRNVTIEWDSSTKPEVKDITGLDEYLDQLDNLEDQLDGRIQTYSQINDPSESWTEDEYNDHIGDLWINPNDGITKRWTGTDWTVVVDSELAQLAQSKAQIFISQPKPPYYKGDLWVQGEDGEIMRCITERLTGDYTSIDWEKASKYTDDTRADAAYTLADSAKGIADNAKIIGDNLVNGLGFKETEITGKYVISPVIAGGHLLIGDTTGTYAQITTEGKLICVNADVRGNIIANSLTLGENVKISSDNISGLDKYATKEDIPVLSEDILYADDVSISSSESANGVITQSITVGDKTYTSIIDGDFVFTDIGLGTNTEDGSKRYTCISKDGLLTAKNAIIYGTVYATDGRFDGAINANEGNIGGCTFENGELRVPAAFIKGKLEASKIDVKDLNAFGATIGGWTIGDDYIYNTDKNNSVGLSTYTTDGMLYPAIWAGLEFGEGYSTPFENDEWYKNCSFYIRPDGYLKATIGEIGGWHINSNSLTASLGDENAGNLSEFSIAADPLQNTSWLSAKYDGDVRFEVSSNGVLTAVGATLTSATLTNADVTGIITANEGEIAGFDIASTGISSKYSTFDLGANEIENTINLTHSPAPRLFLESNNKDTESCHSALFQANCIELKGSDWVSCLMSVKLENGKTYFLYLDEATKTVKFTTE